LDGIVEMRLLILSTDLTIVGGKHKHLLDQDGAKPLHFTYAAGYTRCIEPLLNHGGYSEVRVFLADLEVVKGFGLGLLMHYNHVETLRMVLDRAVSLRDALDCHSSGIIDVIELL
jgi:hypothetical protein